MQWNIADILEALVDVRGDAPALLHGPRSVTWREFDRRSNALANRLRAAGARPNDKLAIYSYNRPEWVESMTAAFKARMVPVNINYRYREEELAYIFENSDSVAVVFESGFADHVESLRARLPKLNTFIQLNDGETRPPWAEDYEEIVAADPTPIDIERSGDDLLFIYTGGTTGMPKGVMWRQEDVWFSLGGGGDLLTGSGKPESLAQHAEHCAGGGIRLIPCCPLMHGTGLLTALNALTMGGSLVTLPSHKFDPAELWHEVQDKQVNALSIVGDVFARPMIAELESTNYDLSSLTMIVSSGIMFSPECKQGLLHQHPGMMIIDSYGSSEATGLGLSVTSASGETEAAKFEIGNRVKVFTDDGREVEPGSGDRGRVGRAGYIPVGYYKDPKKTAETFITHQGVRYAVPGDYATVESDGTLTLLGRGSVCINTGGEKVFPEEVEEVLKRHPAIEDAAVVGLPDPQWGQAITALVTVRQGTHVDEDAAREFVRSTLAGYKVPKKVFVVDDLGRSPAGKMDYKRVTAEAARLAESS